MPYKNRDEANARLRERYANDPEYRAKELARAAIRRSKEDPEKRKKQSRDWYDANKDRANANSVAWRLAHPERAKATQKRHRERNKERLHAENAIYRAKPEKKLLRYLAHILAKYGLTQQAFYEHLQEQHGLCKNPGCAVRLDDKTRVTKVNVDHNHETGEVRGMLCNGCNTSIGHLLESEKKLTGLINYLKP